ncbi:YlmH/Sll1252 family protein [Lachnospiraceae bacterium 62-35]
MEKDEQLLKKRLLELAELCFHRDIPLHTDFLNLNEQTIFHSLAGKLPPVSCVMTGGYHPAERKIVCFLPSYMDKERFVPPLSCICLSPLNLRFAEDLTHRDYLGAVMNLGIERCKIGDIIQNEKEALLFCMEDMSEYISGELTRVRHTQVQAALCQPEDISFTPRYEIAEGSIASVRLDNMLALVYRCSRNKAVAYIEGERVFINGKLALSNSAPLKEGDIISVRGLGRFQYDGVQSETKKGRLFVIAKKYC